MMDIFVFIQYDYDGACLNIQVGSDRRTHVVIVITEMKLFLNKM